MTSTSATKQVPTIPEEVSKKLVACFPPKTVSSGKRVTPDAAAAISEALRLFLVDAHHRASIEAECDDECGVDDDDDKNKSALDGRTAIKANHATRIAADLLMDFS
mmetsp:Transcript_23503/g.55343  ORF Transcript_23503/g.55343 Transcript_23503/m.55343 type:complete len:106 (+) Transcript_23503:100-417(+)